MVALYLGAIHLSQADQSSVKWFKQEAMSDEPGEEAMFKGLVSGFTRKPEEMQQVRAVDCFLNFQTRVRGSLQKRSDTAHGYREADLIAEQLMIKLISQANDKPGDSPACSKQGRG